MFQSSIDPKADRYIDFADRQQLDLKFQSSIDPKADRYLAGIPMSEIRTVPILDRPESRPLLRYSIRRF
jgi:hypothetical protein